MFMALGRLIDLIWYHVARKRIGGARFVFHATLHYTWDAMIPRRKGRDGMEWNVGGG